MYSHPSARRPFQSSQRGRPVGSTKEAAFQKKQLSLFSESLTGLACQGVGSTKPVVIVSFRTPDHE